MLVFGPEGVGKTRLLQSFCKASRSRSMSASHIPRER